jgi:tetratricopeptide (TPR) repeat protein
VMRMLERDPEKRYQRAREIGNDLEDVLAKLNYARRNDAIAKYMQETFEGHIVARKKVLQEVSSKGRASPAALEAAFNEPPVGPSIRSSGEFSMRFKVTSEVDAIGTPSRIARATEEVPPVTDDAPRPEPVAVPQQRSNLPLIAAIAAVVVIAIIVFAATRGGDEPALDPRLAATVTPTEPRKPVEHVDPGVRRREELPPDASMPEIVIEPEGSAQPRIRPQPPREKPANAVELQREGLKAYVSGDLKTALTTLKRAQLANPGYAPTWRTLGMVYEKLGQRTAARLAFQRYLKISPNASDVTTIRARMEHL